MAAIILRHQKVRQARGVGAILDVNEKRLLVVEDDSVTRKLLQQVLAEAGYSVIAVDDGPGAIAAIQQSGLPHMVLLDLGLPSMHGFALSERIKRMGDVPIVIITGDDSEEATVYGIRQYAEDYITKPFNVSEVLARIQRVLSRFADYSYAQAPVLKVDEHLSIDFPNSRIILEEQVIALTPTETSLLYVLVRNKGHIVSPEMLIRRVWPNEEVYEETLRVHMHRLRRKLQIDPQQPQYIQTERGVGYIFLVPEEQNP